MRFSRFKKFTKNNDDVRLLVDPDSLDQWKDGRVLKVRDNRTVKEGDTFRLKPVAISEKQFYIVCPICHEIHVHGLGNRLKDCKYIKLKNGCRLPIGEFSGSRLSHCKQGYERKNYKIDIFLQKSDYNS